jgi:hypothetical protein
LNFKPAEKVNFVYEWKKNGGAFPEVIITRGNEELINSDFIQLGEFLLSDQVINISYFGDDRIKLNMVIENQLNNIFSFIKKLSLPAYFLEILNEFIEKYSYTVPR